MKKIAVYLLALGATPAFSQQWFSVFYDPFNGTQEKAVDFNVNGDLCYIRSNAVCASGTNICSELGVYSISANQLTQAEQFDEVQAGFSVMVDDEILILSSEESLLKKNITITSIDRQTFQYGNSFDLNIPDNRYFSYTIKRAIVYQGKYVVGAQVLDSLMYVNYPGWYNYQQKAVFFVLDKDFQTDTILIVSPSSGAHLKIEDLTIGPDSLLYVSCHEKYLNTSMPQAYLADRKVIYGFNKDFNIVFQWVGPDQNNETSWACLAIGADTTIYINYAHDYRTNLLAVKKDGSMKWECLLDSTFGLNLYSIRKLILAGNGDIIGSGIISSTIDELGETGFLFRIDATGSLKWKRAFRVNKGIDPSLPLTFPYRSNLEDLDELPNGDLLMVGWVRKYVNDSQASDPYEHDIWLVRTSAAGCLWADCPYIQDIVVKDNYIPIVSHLNEWVIDYTFPTFPSKVRRYRFSPDSVLTAGKYYHELIYSESMSGGPWETSGAFFREENGRVFKIGGVLGDPERLIYNFNFSIGDSLQGNPGIGQATRHVTQTDIIHLLDGMPRKRLVLNSLCGESEWIEGMGDMNQLFESEIFCSLAGDMTEFTVRCFNTDGQLVYKRADLDDCYTSSTEEAVLQAIWVYPNPVSDLIFLSTDHIGTVEKVVLFNNIGQKVLIVENWRELTSAIDVSGLGPGFYLGVANISGFGRRVFKFVKV